MKIKNPILASMLTKLGVEVKAELVIDDSTGTPLTFPDISDVAEIAVDVAVVAPDGTYVIPDGEATITIEVVGGLVVTFEREEPGSGDAPEVDAEVLEVLGTLVEANTKQHGLIVALQEELKDLKASLKHDDGKGAAAAQKTDALKFKIIN